jgi:hypothetical protein
MGESPQMPIRFAQSSMPALLRFGYAVLLGSVLLSPVLQAQPARTPMQRLPSATLDVTPPSARVSGVPGTMKIIDRTCRARPREALRQRIVDVAAQEWAFFGFSIDDEMVQRAPEPAGARRFFFNMDEADASRVADSIAGYWAAAPASDWILERQNGFWKGPEGIAARWRDAWSAAFISWVMCESGLADSTSFKRAIAHHSYIDQAIEAAAGRAPTAVFTAHEPGARQLLPGDLLCRGNRPAYQNLAQRRAQMGEGARTHCDIVVKVNEGNGEILAIGGNVRGWVRMKRLPGGRQAGGEFAPLPYNGRRIFAHLQLRAEANVSNALDFSPTRQAISCRDQGTELEAKAEIGQLLAIQLGFC